nr:phage tail tip lysozyme [uncultured Oscillibacter sp.]
MTTAEREKYIWTRLTAAGMTPAGAAGLMGNLYAESGLDPCNLQNTHEKKLGLTDAAYTAAVDAGTYTNFAGDGAGYGLAQWTYWSRKEALLTYVRATGRSVGNLEAQVGFLLQELAGSYKGLLSTLKSIQDVRAASDAVLLQFERPADQSEAAQVRRAGYGQTYFDRYAQAAPASVTENQLRRLVADTIQAWIGAKKGSTLHADILAVYNGYKPLARGYTLKTTDAYCAATVSAAYIRAGIAAWTGTECGVEKYTLVAKARGIWVEDDTRVPAVGDACVYDWDDNGVGDCTGSADHIGIVTASNGTTFTVTEGNMSGGVVGTRTVKVNARYIRGFICPDFARIAAELSGKNESEEIENMSKEELTALIRETVKEVLDEENPVYKDLKDVPECWQPTAAALLEAGAVNGGTPAEVCATDLNLRKETLKAVVVAAMYHDAQEGKR